MTQNTLNPTQRKSIGAGTYTGPRKRAENEALPRTWMPKARYVPEQYEPARSGAMDAMKIASKGTRT